jgi:hypothetical protein
MVSNTEKAYIRNQLRVRFNKKQGCYEVYTIMHPNASLFRWYKITKEHADWYIKQFHLTLETFTE